MAQEVTRWRHAYRWDLDKTYLDTRFEKFGELLRIPFQGAEDKVNVPGSAALLRELTRAIDGQADSYVSIVSGSPRQLREVLEAKLRLDGVTWQEFHLKPQLKNLSKGRLRAVREQVGYKLPLMLRSRVALPATLRETLFGDDAEVDVLVYSLYADLLCGRSSGEELDALLKKVGASAAARQRCASDLASLEPSGSDREPVETIFIHLDSGSPPALFAPFGARVIPVFNYYQAALVLFARGHLDVQSVVRITAAFLKADRCGPWELANLFQDIARRGHLPTDAMETLAIGVQDDSAGNEAAEVVWNSAQRLLDLQGMVGPSPQPDPPPLDYPALLDHLKSSRRAARRARSKSESG